MQGEMDRTAGVMAPRYLRCGLGEDVDPKEVLGEGHIASAETTQAEDSARQKLGYAASLVQVRNTFIEVQEVGDGGNPQYLHLPSRKRGGHLRCVSEPMASLSLRCGNEPASVSSLAGKFPDGDIGIGSLLQAAVGEAMGTTGAPPDEADRVEEASSRSSGSVRRTNHLRQASMQTVVTIDEEHDHSDEEGTQCPRHPDIGFGDVSGFAQQERADDIWRLACSNPSRDMRGESPLAELHTPNLPNALVPGPVVPALAFGIGASTTSSLHTQQESEAFRKRCSSCATIATQLLPRNGLWLCLACWKQWEALRQDQFESAPPRKDGKDYCTAKVPHIGVAMREPPQTLAPPPLLPCTLPSATSSTNIGAIGDWTAQRQLATWCGAVPWQNWKCDSQASQCGPPVGASHLAPSAADPGILLAAYAQGFSAGAVAGGRAAVAANEVSGNNRPSLGGLVGATAAQLSDQAHRLATEREMPKGTEIPALGKKNQKSQASKVPCKWFTQGTCKFGSACRFAHQETAVQIRPPSTTGTDTTIRKTEESTCANLCVKSSSMASSQPIVRSKASNNGLGAHSEMKAASSNSECDSDREDDRRQAVGKAPYHCHVVWCDQRAFKEASEQQRLQLEEAVKMPVRTHKTAEKCMRLIQKKKRSAESRQARPPTVFLISWANAPTLVPYLCEVSEQSTKVVVLCDLCGCRGRDAARRWSRHFPLVDCIADSWQQAVEQVAMAVNMLQKSTCAPA